MAVRPQLIWCAACGKRLAEVAVSLGWSYGACLPGSVSCQPLHFADQNWKRPDRIAYILALAKHRPAVATVLDWEHDHQLSEVLSWAEEAAQHVLEAVYLIPKVSGQVHRLPRLIGGKRVVLAYSVPTGYGGSPLHLSELAGWPVHLLGGEPHRQMRIAAILGCIAEVVSVDGNTIGRKARLGQFWRRERGPRGGHWCQLRDAGDDREDNFALECFRRSLVAVREAWEVPS